MSTSICATFRSLAFQTHDQLSSARRVKHQPLEETFTDTNILQLKLRHGSEIYSKTFSKPVEGRNGADWEWWLTNSSMTSWLGLRVQAKVVNLSSRRFEHLHYRSGKSKIYQREKLDRECRSAGLVPLYCFYLDASDISAVSKPACGTFASAHECYGCSIASLAHVENLFKAGRADSLEKVIAQAYPWHCLVCCAGHGGGDLPSRAWSFLQGALGVGSNSPESHTNQFANAGPRARPPRYVLSAMQDVESDSAPTSIGGVLIIRGDGG